VIPLRIHRLRALKLGEHTQKFRLWLRAAALAALSAAIPFPRAALAALPAVLAIPAAVLMTAALPAVLTIPAVVLMTAALAALPGFLAVPAAVKDTASLAAFIAAALMLPAVAFPVVQAAAAVGGLVVIAAVSHLVLQTATFVVREAAVIRLVALQAIYIGNFVVLQLAVDSNAALQTAFNSFVDLRVIIAVLIALQNIECFVALHAVGNSIIIQQTAIVCNFAQQIVTNLVTRQVDIGSTVTLHVDIGGLAAQEVAAFNGHVARHASVGSLDALNIVALGGIIALKLANPCLEALWIARALLTADKRGPNSAHLVYYPVLLAADLESSNAAATSIVANAHAPAAVDLTAIADVVQLPTTFTFGR
jgi:hypothetical protein